MNYIGIDPGLSGAVAVLHSTGLYTVYDTPVMTLQRKSGIRHEYDMPSIVRLVGMYSQDAYAAIEEAQAMPGQGTRSMFTCGLGMGVWLGVLASLRIPYLRVRPATWKKALGVGKDKEESRLRAGQCFPDADLRRKKDHGRAEALLIALYIQRRVMLADKREGVCPHQ